MDERGRFKFRLKGRDLDFPYNRMVAFLADSQLRMAYLENPKSACTSVKNVMFYCDRGFAYVEPENIHYSKWAFWFLNIENSADTDVKRFDDADPLLYSVSRHPFDRFVSGFVDKLLPGSQESYFFARDYLSGVGWVDLAADPVKAALAFLELLDQDRLELHPGLIDGHFRHQVDNMGLRAGMELDFIGKIEDPDPILDMFEKVTGVRPAEMFKERRRVSSHPAKAELLGNADVRRSVERVYAPDFEAFGYL